MTRQVSQERLLKSIDAMAGVPVLVIADLVLDVFEYGRIGRISREAPVLILDHVRTDQVPGGGANAIHNLCALGGRPRVVGRLGADDAGDALLGLLASAGADVRSIWRETGYTTPVKRRILAGSAHSVKQQIVRVDRGGGPGVTDLAGLEARIRQAGQGAAGVLVSDYSFGMIHDKSAAMLREAFGRLGRPLFVDSRAQIRLFHGMAAATPNLAEAEQVQGAPIGDDPARRRQAVAQLRAALDAEALVVTLGSQGMEVATRQGEAATIPVYGTDEVADVTGAGDTVIATLTLAMLSGCAPLEAALLANIAGGIVVMKRGTATVSPDELRAAVRSKPDPAAFLGGR